MARAVPERSRLRGSKLAEEMYDDLIDDSSIEDAEDGAEDSRSDRTNNALVVAVLLTLIVVLVVGFFVVKELTGERAPTTMAEAKIAQLEEQVATDPADPNLRLRLVEAYYTAKNYGEAQYHLDEMYSQEVTGPVLALALYANARIEQARGNADDAIDMYKESIELLDYGDTHYMLAMAYVDAERWDEAITELTSYLEAFPTDSGALVQMGRAYEGKGDPNKALELYKQALTYIPDDPEITADIARLEGR